MHRRISSPLFVGRSAELCALSDALGRASAGDGCAILLEGEAGIGKSRLIREAERRAREAGASTLVGECLPMAEGELAFAPVVSALRPAIEDPAALDGLAPTLRSAIAALWPTVGAEETREVGREQLFEAVYRVLARLAGRCPVMLIVEDVHWIDPSSRDLLAFLVRNARRDRLLVVATYRPDELHRGHHLRPFLAELERSGHSERLELGGLEPDEVLEQIAAILGRRPQSPVAQSIVSRCEGNPFFVEELIATADRGAGLPESLREALLLRVQRLSAGAQRMLQAAAAIGRSVDHRLLARVAHTSEPELLDALREATAQHVLLPGTDGVSYRFRHALLQEAIYEDTLAGERLALHRAIAESLSAHPELAGDEARAAAELAHHWFAAGKRAAALAASIDAAAEARRMHAYHETQAHLGRVLRLWDSVPDPEAIAGTDRVEILIKASEMAENVGDTALGLELARQACRAVDERAEPLRAAAAETSLGRSLWNAGLADEAIVHHGKALRLVPEQPPSVARADGLAAYGRFVMLTGAFKRALRPLEEGLELARPLGARMAEASTLASLAIVYSQLGERERAITAARDSLRISTELDAGEEMMRGYINGSQAIDDDGRLEEAVALGFEGLEDSHRLGLDRAAGDHLLMQTAWRLVRLGRLDEAQRLIGPALETVTTTFNVAAIKNIAGYLAATRGDFGQADSLLEGAWELMQRSGGFQLIGLALAWRVTLCLWLEQQDRARMLAWDGIERVSGAEGQLVYNADVFWLAARVEADHAARLRAMGRHADAADAVAAADDAANALAQAIARYPNHGAPPKAQAVHTLALAEASRARGNREPQAWQAAADRLSAVGEAYLAAYAEMRTAEVLALAGAAVHEVAEPLRRAHVAAVSIGIRPFLDEVEGLARRARVHLEEQPAEERGIAEQLGLTERELEVLSLVAEGRTNRQIGEQLFITDKTASAHVSRILMKLGVANRAEAAAAAHRLGLARPAPASSVI